MQTILVGYDGITVYEGLKRFQREDFQKYRCSSSLCKKLILSCCNEMIYADTQHDTQHAPPEDKMCSTQTQYSLKGVPGGKKRILDV